MKPELTLTLSPTRLNPVISTARRSPGFETDQQVREIVWNRDDHVCGFCGFRASRHQEIVVWGGNTRDVDGMATACLFCHQCFYLHRAVEMRSAVAIWLPRLSQADLHRAARELYVERLGMGPAAKYARRILARVIDQRTPLKERLGSDDLERICTLLESRDAESQTLLESLRVGLRLFPLDRRIVSAGDLEFNQFPQVLAYWRSADGPHGKASSTKWIAQLEQALPPGDDPSEPVPTSH